MQLERCPGDRGHNNVVNPQHHIFGLHSQTSADGEEVANLIGIIQGLPRQLEADLTPMFVFDDGVTEPKADEIAERSDNCISVINYRKYF